MTRYVIGPDVAIHLAGEEAVIPDGHHMLAPALLRSQMALIYVVHVGSGRDAAVWRLGRRFTGNSAADRWWARRPVTGGRS
jgi:hypothetical protein